MREFSNGIAVRRSARSFGGPLITGYHYFVAKAVIDVGRQ